MDFGRGDWLVHHYAKNWSCSVSTVWVRIPQREERNEIVYCKSNSSTVGLKVTLIYYMLHIMFFRKKNDLLHDIKCCEFIFLKHSKHTENTVYYTNCFISLNVECVADVVIECCRFCQVSALCAQFYHIMFLSVKLLLDH
jgi:hypothetical protein